MFITCTCGALCCENLPPTALLLETVPHQLGNIQDKLEILQHKMEQQQGTTKRLLDELATLTNTTMDGT